MSDSNRQKHDDAANELVQEAYDKLEEIEKKMEDERAEFEKEQTKLHWQFEKRKFELYESRKKIVADIPRFWATALEHHPILAQTIMPDDGDALNYLSDIFIEQSGVDTLSRVKFVFTFKPNPYFENKELTREFELNENDLKSVEPAPIKWKPGKRLTGHSEPVNKKRPFSQTKTSFFDWFDKEIETEEDDATELANALLDDFWPNAFKYYQGVADADDGDNDDGENEIGDDGEGDGGVRFWSLLVRLW